MLQAISVGKMPKLPKLPQLPKIAKAVIVSPKSLPIENATVKPGVAVNSIPSPTLPLKTRPVF